MSTKSKTVDILGIDTETLEKDLTFPDAYAFYIRLSEEPDSLWQKYLAEWKNALYTMQREINVFGDRLRVVFVYGDDVQNCANYAAQLVEMINRRIDEHNKQVEIQEKREMTRQEADHKKEQELLAKLRSVKPHLSSTPTIETTVEELLSAYEADEQVADEKFGDAIVQITGIVGRVEVKDAQDIYYIALTSAERNLLQSVRCLFDKKHVSALNQLNTGETVTVKGRYDGSIVDIRMIDCAIVH